MKSFLVLAILLLSFTFSYAQHEYAPLQQHDLKYKNWTYKSVRDGGGEIDLRDFAQGKKLLMVVYFAAWCPNWKLEAPVAQKLYDKYKANGFDVIGVSEYAGVDDAKASLAEKQITFPVVYESESKDAKKKTPHYDYRQKTGDTRSWGSPWNIFIEPSSVEKKGDTLLKKAYVVNGELIEDEAEIYIRQKLGLPAEEAKAGTATAAKDKAIEICDENKKEITFKKP